MATPWTGRSIPGTNALEVIELGVWNDSVNWQELPSFFWWDNGEGGSSAWQGRTPV